MKFWAELIIGVLRILLPAFFENTKPRMEDAGRQPELKRRLRERVNRTWATVLAVALCAGLLVGCTRVVYVPPGEPVRLRETISDAKIWVMGQDGTPVAGVMDLPEGWYVLPGEEAE